MAKFQKHKDESGNPTNNRGKAPHKNGYHAANKGVNHKKVWWEIGVGKEIIKVACPWKKGARS